MKNRERLQVFIKPWAIKELEILAKKLEYTTASGVKPTKAAQYILETLMKRQRLKRHKKTLLKNQKGHKKS